jgi:hypothetical protein
MSTIAKIAANRKNSTKSTGPNDTTSTRFNAIKHGLLAEGITELDSPETFPHFCATIETELKPLGEIETFIARQVVLCMVRLKRVRLLEAEFVTARLHPPIKRTETTTKGCEEPVSSETPSPYVSRGRTGATARHR